MMPFGQRLGGVLFHFSKRTTLHGVNHMAQAKKARSRFFWLLIMVCASMGFSINLYNLIEKYVQIPVLTNVHHDSEAFLFPDISFCNLNPIYFPPEYTPQYQTLSKLISEYRELAKLPIQKRRFIDSLADFLYVQRIPYSHPAWSFIMDCKYQGQHCNFTHFDVHTIWPYGNCYTFNPKKLNMKREAKKDVTYRGFRPNLQIILYKALVYPQQFRLDPHNNIQMPSGIILMIHEPGSFPHITESYLVDTYTVVDIKITRKLHMAKLGKCQPHRKNYSYADSVKYTTTSFLGRWADCVYQTLQMTVYKNCNCLLEYYPILADQANGHFCKNPRWNITMPEFQRCLAKSFHEIEQLNSVHSPKSLGECYRDLCEHSTYTTVISHAHFPAVVERNSHMEWIQRLAKIERDELEHYNRSDIAKKAIKSPANLNTTLLQVLRMQRADLLDVDFVESNFMMFRVVPSSLFMDMVEETEEYPLSRVMSDIGGCMGLWVGASLITLFEIFDLCLDFLEAFNGKTIPRYRINGASRALFEHIDTADSFPTAAPSPKPPDNVLSHSGDHQLLLSLSRTISVQNFVYSCDEEKMNKGNKSWQNILTQTHDPATTTRFMRTHIPICSERSVSLQGLDSRRKSRLRQTASTHTSSHTRGHHHRNCRQHPKNKQKTRSGESLTIETNRRILGESTATTTTTNNRPIDCQPTSLGYIAGIDVVTTV